MSETTLATHLTRSPATMGRNSQLLTDGMTSVIRVALVSTRLEEDGKIFYKSSALNFLCQKTGKYTESTGTKSFLLLGIVSEESPSESTIKRSYTQYNF